MWIVRERTVLRGFKRRLKRSSRARTGELGEGIVRFYYHTLSLISRILYAKGLVNLP